MDKIERYTKSMIQKLANRDGGLLVWPYTAPYDIGVSGSTVKAEMEIFRKYRNYYS